MHYSNFPGRINVEKTSEQYFQLLPPIESYKNLFNRIDTEVWGWMKDKWTMEIDQRELYNGKDLYKGGIEKYYRENSEKIHCSTRKNITSEIACPIENLLLRL